MTIYSSHMYEVGGRYTHGGDIERHTDAMPAGLFQVWEIGEDETHWVCNDGGIWTAVGEADSVELTWDELLAEFGPVTDDEEEIGAPWPPVVEVPPW